ncbi:MAG: HlyD family efflux transporter periplasmic adaptor subunit, partial [Planctomycetaceae bacterium]
MPSILRDGTLMLNQAILPDPAAPRREHAPISTLSRVLGSLPNLIVFSALGALLYFGHHNGWRLPSFSELRGAPAVIADDWCTEHLVPDSQCIECKPELSPKPELYGFCRDHGVAECVIDHPELAQVKGPPQLPKYDTARAITVRDRFENNSRDTLHARRVQFASIDSVNKAGIEVDVAQERSMIESITANGELTFDPTHVAHLSPRVPGSVVLVLKTIGDEVAAGEILALVDAALVGQAKSQLLHAVVQKQLKQSTHDRLKRSADSGAVSQKSLIEAESALQEAIVGLNSARQSLGNLGFEVPEGVDRQTPEQIEVALKFLGIPPALCEDLPEGSATANLIPIRAPCRGAIVAAEIVAGEVVDNSRVLFTIADPSRLWLILNVRPEEARYVKRGLPVEFQTDDRSQKARGTVSWVSPAFDEQTRTLKVRVPFDNAEGRFRDHTYGTGRIILREEPQAIVVPREALQSTADVQFVFVRERNYFEDNSPKVFLVRQVRTGARDDRYVELLAGVL